MRADLEPLRLLPCIFAQRSRSPQHSDTHVQNTSPPTRQHQLIAASTNVSVWLSQRAAIAMRPWFVGAKSAESLALQLHLSSERFTPPQHFGRRHFATHETPSTNISNNKYHYLIRPTDHRGDPTLRVDATRTGDARFLIAGVTELADFYRTSTLSSKTLSLQRSAQNLIIQSSNAYHRYHLRDYTTAQRSARPRTLSEDTSPRHQAATPVKPLHRTSILIIQSSLMMPSTACRVTATMTCSEVWILNLPLTGPDICNIPLAAGCFPMFRVGMAAQWLRFPRLSLP